MSVSVLYFPPLDFRWVRYERVVAAADVIAVIHRSYGSAIAQAGTRSLIDMETVETVEITFSDMNSATQTAVSRLTQTGKRIRSACHAPTDVTFGIARIYQTLMENAGVAETLVSRDREAVVQFLGLEALPDPADGVQVL